MTDVNIPLLRKAVEWAEAESERPFEVREWDQRMWSVAPDVADPYLRRLREGKAPECGTTYCIAGYVCESLGIDTTEEGWAMPAADALGLNMHEADDLFHSENTIEDVRRIAEDLAGERL